MYKPLYSFIFSGHLGCFHISGNVNNVAVNMGVVIPIYNPAFNSFG